MYGKIDINIKVDSNISDKGKGVEPSLSLSLFSGGSHSCVLSSPGDGDNCVCVTQPAGVTLHNIMSTTTTTTITTANENDSSSHPLLGKPLDIKFSL